MVVAKETFWSLAYADDIVLLPTSKGELREKIGAVLEKNKLLLNEEKFKIKVEEENRGKPGYGKNL